MNNFASNKLLKPGAAKFEIAQVWNKDKEGKLMISKSGNPMIRLKLLATDEQGEQGTVWDYVLLNSLNKITALLQSIGKVEWLERITQNNFSFEALVGQIGQCTLKTDSHEVYGTKTVIAWYLGKNPLAKDTTLVQQTDAYRQIPAAKPIISDDELPF